MLNNTLENYLISTFCLISITCIVFISPLHAQVFRYTDESGRTHYTSDQSKIPERYKSQAPEAAKLPSLGKYQSYGPRGTIPGLQKDTSVSNYAGTSKRVEIFVTTWCPHCKSLENFLTANKISFTRYDIEHNSKGMKLYNQLGAGGVPLVRVGETVMRGFDADGLLRALGKRR